MALPPTLQALAIGAADAPHTLELYVRACTNAGGLSLYAALLIQGPFSAKQLCHFDRDAVPLLMGDGAPYAGQVRVIVRPVPQPWHASSTYLHEAALAVARLAPTDATVLADPKTNPFWVFSQALMQESSHWYEAPVRGKSGDEVRAELASLAVRVLGDEPRKAGARSHLSLPDGMPLGQAVREWTRVSDDGNTGSQIVKIGRQNSVHVTPTALWNGVVEPSISSSFTQEQWADFFRERIGSSGGP